MASSSSFSSTLSLKLLFPTPPIKPDSNMRVCVKPYAMRRETHKHNYSGGLVDKNLIVLRKRIHETKMMEGNYEPPTEWTYWEKQFYATNYGLIICDAMGWLQSYLMETRPSVVLPLIALIALNVPFSSALVMFYLLQLTIGVLSGCHLSS